MAKLQALKIHPAIGIARLGNHPDHYFIGPEKPNQIITEKEIHGYKSPDPEDGNILKIKRQACRFRVFAYYDDGTTEELDSSKADINWTVQLANTKAKSRRFYQIEMPKSGYRNQHVGKEDRKGLALQPKAESITGSNKQKKFEPCNLIVKEPDGTVLTSEPIHLGEIRTDDHGNLLVLGGHGNSGSVKKQKLTSFVDNDYWYDDTSDGCVQAEVTLKGSKESLKAEDAWVIVACPNYVPHIPPVVNLYDVLYTRRIILDDAKDVKKPLFYRDIYPILKRALDVIYIHKMEAHYNIADMLKPDTSDDDRKFLFRMMRLPDGTGGNMPKLFGDRYRSLDRGARLAMPSAQYIILKKWKEGKFEVDSIENTRAPKEITPDGLDKAALEHCSGGPFFPGIETSWFIRDKYPFVDNFRLDTNFIKPGDLTKQNALPWQADFFDCRKDEDIFSSYPGDTVGWWPYSRPDDVYREGSDKQSPWVPEEEFRSYEDMVKKWKYLGIVVEKDGKYVEVQRNMPK